MNLHAIFRRAIERHFNAIFVVERNAEARAKLAQLVFVQLFLLVRDVLAFAGFTQSVTFNSSRENDGRAALVLDGRFVRGVDLARIVPSEPQAAQRFIRKRLDQLQQPRIAPEEMLPHVRA